jgi:hypothetical protein
VRRKKTLNVLLGMGGHEGAPLALAACESLANSSMALRTVPWLTADRAASSVHGESCHRLPFARLRAAQNQALDLLVQGGLKVPGCSAEIVATVYAAALRWAGDRWETIGGRESEKTT